MTQHKGVSYYTSGTAVLRVHFPEDKICCYWCPFRDFDYGTKQYQCKLTNELLVYPMTNVGSDCPVVLDETEG